MITLFTVLKQIITSNPTPNQIQTNPNQPTPTNFKPNLKPNPKPAMQKTMHGFAASKPSFLGPAGDLATAATSSTSLGQGTVFLGLSALWVLGFFVFFLEAIFVGSLLLFSLVFCGFGQQTAIISKSSYKLLLSFNCPHFFYYEEVLGTATTTTTTTTTYYY